MCRYVCHELRCLRPQTSVAWPAITAPSYTEYVTNSNVPTCMHIHTYIYIFMSRTQVFSASNYCGMAGNYGAIVVFDSEMSYTLEVRDTFTSSWHIYEFVTIHMCISTHSFVTNEWVMARYWSMLLYVLQCVIAVYCNVLQCVAVCCRVSAPSSCLTPKCATTLEVRDTLWVRDTSLWVRDTSLSYVRCVTTSSAWNELQPGGSWHVCEFVTHLSHHHVIHLSRHELIDVSRTSISWYICHVTNS